jgi:hypothetical protein
MNATNGKPTGVPAVLPTATSAFSYDSTNFKLCAYVAAWKCTAALSDIAEWAPAPGTESGDLIAITTTPNPVNDPTAPTVFAKTSNAYDEKIAGVISEYAENEQSANGYKLSDDYHAVTLAGRVPVKVSTENGPVASGDPLTSSSIPGVAMKATESGPIVGKALGAYDNSDPTAVGKIMVFVSVGWYVKPLAENSEQQSATSSASISTNSLSIGDYKLAIDADNNLAATIPAGSKLIFKDPAGQALAWVSSLGEAVFEKVTALVGDFNKLVFGELIAKKDAKIAGEASFEVGATEILIKSDKVTDGSLINLTPTSKTEGLSLYVKEKKPGEGFVVALERSVGDQPAEATPSASHPIKFTWFILNQE